MVTDEHLLNAWYHYAAGAEGFIGAALKAHRSKVFMLQEQQRALLQIQGERDDPFWLQLQAMPLPRMNQFETDLQQIVEQVSSRTGGGVSVDRRHLAELIRIGLTP